MKKYLLLIPLLFVMLLNCITFGQVVAADSGIDYSQYFKDPEEITIYCDCFDVDFIKPYVTDSITSNRDYNRLYEAFGDDLLSFNNYFYSVYTTTDNYNNFKNKKKDAIFYIDFVEIKDTDAFYEDDEYAIYKGMYNIDFCFTVSPDGSVSDIKFNGSNTHWYEKIGFYYDKISANHLFFEYSGTLINPPPFVSNIQSILDSPKYHFFIDTTIPDFTYPDGISKPDNGSLNVDVNINPAFNGEFDRKYKSGNSTLIHEDFDLTVTNNSSFPIQYAMFIAKKGEILTMGSSNMKPDSVVGFEGNPTFAYVSDEWCYTVESSVDSPSIHTANAYKNRLVNKPSAWHYLSSGETSNVTISYSQINLIKNEDYEVFVYAIKSNYDAVVFSSMASYYMSPDVYTIELNLADLVYHSSFTCINPAEYDPENYSNGVYAYNNENEDDARKLFNRISGYIDDNGETVIDKIDAETLKVSNVNDPHRAGNAWQDSSSVHGGSGSYRNSVSSEINTLSNNFTSYFSFINKVFNYLPQNIQSLFTLGLTSFVVIGVLKSILLR